MAILIITITYLYSAVLYFPNLGLKAREKQTQRANCINAELTREGIATHCSIQKNDHLFLENALVKLGLSTRAYFRVLKLSRTIADLHDTDPISPSHIQEVLWYRRLTGQSLM